MRSDVTLAKLHFILQVVMEWTNSHRHQFIVGQTTYGDPWPGYGFEMRDEWSVRLDQVAPREGSKFHYEYDFGDGWMHTLLVEKILPPEPGQHYPVCIKGRRACPPEGIGDIRMYSYFVESTRNPDHPEYPGNEEFLEWIAGGFDPDEFDLKKTNEVLRAQW